MEASDYSKLRVILTLSTLFFPFSINLTSVFHYTLGVKRVLAFILLVLFFLTQAQSAQRSGYDFTLYQSPDNSVMGVKGDKLGLDITGYGFIGESSRQGIYIRLGLQTPFDTIIGYLKRLAPEKPFGDIDGTLDGSETLPEEENLPSPSIEKENFSDFTISLPSPFPTLPEISFPSLGGGTSSTLPEASLNEEEQSGQENVEENDTPFGPPIDTTPTLDSEQDGQEIKAPAYQDDFRKEWRLLLTLGPAYRSFMGEKGMVYLGFGFTSDFGHKVEVEKDKRHTTNTTFAVFGGDIDLGFRYTIEKGHTVRLGVHFATSFIGIKLINRFDEESIKVDGNTYIYGYAFTKRGILETLEGRGYIMLAMSIDNRKKKVYNYSNTTTKLGGGTSTRVQ